MATCPKCGKPYNQKQQRQPRYPKGAPPVTEYWHRVPGPDLQLPGFGSVPQYNVCSVKVNNQKSSNLD